MEKKTHDEQDIKIVLGNRIRAVRTGTGAWGAGETVPPHPHGSTPFSVACSFQN